MFDDQQWVTRVRKKAAAAAKKAQLPTAADRNGRVKLAMAGKYQTQLARISGGRNERTVNNPVRVGRVIREPGNKHDPGALVVKVGMGRVGYVPREAQDRVNALLGDRKKATAVVWVTGGWDRGGGDLGSFGCELDVP